mmetsp:Transcript_15297/g.30071  ORF Transcript_15297/g.30071 Transcript_15297/m.30071 type:complete len:139 (+) Transcript_15297:688-1104(+)
MAAAAGNIQDTCSGFGVSYLPGGCRLHMRYTVNSTTSQDALSIETNSDHQGGALGSKGRRAVMAEAPSSHPRPWVGVPISVPGCCGAKQVDLACAVAPNVAAVAAVRGQDAAAAVGSVVELLRLLGDHVTAPVAATGL